MNSKKLVLSMAAIMLACAGAQARQTPRTAEPPAATIERESQLAEPRTAPRTDTATDKKEDPEADARSKPKTQQQQPSPSDKTDARPLDPSARDTRQARRPPRRAVEQILTPTPRILGSAVPAVSPNAGVITYGPTLETRAPPRSLAPPAGTVGTNPATCTGPNCLDSSGQRLGTGIGNSAITPQGRLCTKGLVGVQCF